MHGTTFTLDGKIYRALRGEHASFVVELLRSPHAERLFDAGLVKCQIADLDAEGYDVVIECDRVSVVSYPQEWPSVMLREAGLAIARLGRALAEAGATLLDAHPWNVLFEGTRPIWVDLGSLVPASSIGDAWVAEFRRHVVLPLVLRSRGWHHMADVVERDHPGHGIKRLWDRRVVRSVFPASYTRMARGSREPAEFFRRLEEYVDGLRPAGQQGEWSSYVQAVGADPARPETFKDAKQTAVFDYLTSTPPGTVLDVGANAGWFSELAVHAGNKVIAVDTDEPTLQALYARARGAELPILTLKMDAMWPLGSHGLGLSHPPATERLRADTSLWLAVLHHMTGSQRLSYEAVARVIDAFTEQTAIVEYIPRDDEHIRDWPRASEDWWDVDRFVEAMRGYFDSVETRASSPDPRLMLRFRRATT
jgi:SAM-dependent methyltransferase